MPGRRKPEPSLEYLKSLEVEMDIAKGEFEEAKAKFYKIVADAKLYQPNFEVLRLKCLEATKKMETLEAEIIRVKKYVP